MSFTTEPLPPRHVAEEVLPGIRRLVAPNVTPMTYHGTNTYIIDGPEGAVVIDPGPESHPGHVDDVMRACNGKIALIMLSHTHHDHHGLLAALRTASGAPTCGFTHTADPSVTTDLHLADGESLSGLTAVHTPGHCADHICLALPGGILFSADHVMAWSTTVVSPPGGHMAAYFRSLERLLARDDSCYLPGHGPILREPRAYVRALLFHRRQREAAVAEALQSGPTDTESLMDQLYHKLNPTLRRAAERNVLAHLLKLEEEGRVGRHGDLWYVH
jgi:glyoxylase-like metal-dependent hydrolase (beta-lactamase superfamily II)